ncbi:MAG: hypothetical protein HQL93_01490 [Magnetococcales bacterium]|nr:hypothetical protein [Magnetococcales bacterium]
MMRPANDLPEVYLCMQPVDFRKGMMSLAALVEGNNNSMDSGCFLPICKSL